MKRLEKRNCQEEKAKLNFIQLHGDEMKIYFKFEPKVKQKM